MASSYSTDLKLELMVTGEKAGLWGDITNTNLNILQQAICGFEQVSVNATNAITLAFTNGALSNGKNAIIEITGTPSADATVNIPDGVEKSYIFRNSTSGSSTLTIKTTSGSGVAFSGTDKGYKYLYSNGTNVTAITLASPPGGSDTQIQFNSGGTAFGGSANLVWDGTNVVLGATGALRLGDTTGGEYVGLKAPGTVSSSYTLTLPTATGTADQILVTDGSGNLSFTDNSGGTSWQAVKTTGFTAVAGEGYFCDTSSAGFTATLPATPTLGDEVTFVDYAGTFDTNNLTVGRNSENIQGSAADLTVSVERAGLTLVYSGATQGWLLKDK
jgi:hypothetical protein